MAAAHTAPVIPQCNNGYMGPYGNYLPSSPLPSVITTNLDVPSGSVCVLTGNEVMGNVTVEGSLTAWGGHFDKNVTIKGGEFAGKNNRVQIDGNLSFLNPAADSYNGFWGNQDGSNLVKGNVTYTIDNTMAYPLYHSPLLDFEGGTNVIGNFYYSDQGTGWAGHLNTAGLTAKNFPAS
jgi:hypothetical protein